jgi:hypothetical protein
MDSHHSPTPHLNPHQLHLIMRQKSELMTPVLGYSPGTIQNELKGSDRGIFAFFGQL